MQLTSDDNQNENATKDMRGFIKDHKKMTTNHFE